MGLGGRSRRSRTDLDDYEAFDRNEADQEIPSLRLIFVQKVAHRDEHQSKNLPGKALEGRVSTFPPTPTRTTRLPVSICERLMGTLISVEGPPRVVCLGAQTTYPADAARNVQLQFARYHYHTGSHHPVVAADTEMVIAQLREVAGDNQMVIARFR